MSIGHFRSRVHKSAFDLQPSSFTRHVRWRETAVNEEEFMSITEMIAE